MNRRKSLRLRIGTVLIMLLVNNCGAPAAIPSTTISTSTIEQSSPGEQHSPSDLIVWTINTIGKDPNYPIRLQGIAQKIHDHLIQYSSTYQIGLIGLQEVKGGMSGCRIDESLGNGAKCLAGELSNVFRSTAQSRFTGGDSDLENGIIVDDNWTIIEVKEWGIHSTFLGVGEGHRKLLMVLLVHKTRGSKLRFYSVHFSPGKSEDDRNERAYQAEKVVAIVKNQAEAGELPPIVVGDFNTGRNFVTGEAEKSIRIMEADFWRPIDHLLACDNPITGTPIDLVYIGKTLSFPTITGGFAPVKMHHIMTTESTPVSGTDYVGPLSDHNALGFELYFYPENVEPGTRLDVMLDTSCPGPPHPIPTPTLRVCHAGQVCDEFDDKGNCIRCLSAGQQSP